MNPRVIANAYRLQRQESRRGMAASADPRPKPYFELQVETQIRRSNLNILYTLGKELLEIIEQAGLKNRHSFWSVSHDIVQLYNCWTLVDANTLTAAELALPDNPAYAKFERLIVEETKDLTIRVAPGRDCNNELLNTERYLYMQVKYKSETRSLAEFQARLEASVVPFAHDYDWMLGDAFLGITGTSGALTQIWLVPESTAVQAERRILTTAWQPLLSGPPECEILEPTPFDPILGELNNNSFAERLERHRALTQRLVSSDLRI